MTTSLETLRAQLQGHATRYPEQNAAVQEFMNLLDDGALAFVRERQAGHFTASCWLVDPSGERVLLTHHRKLQRWLQLGGHADGEQDLALAALREAQEESGLADLRVEPEIFDVDRHRIPARAGEPAHDHFDVRFVIVANGSLEPVISEESLDLAWREIRDLLDDAETDESMRRMAQRWVNRRGPQTHPSSY